MATPTPAASLKRFIGKFSAPVQRVAVAALAKMRARLPGAIELVYDNYNALAIGFASTERASDAVFSIAVFPRRPILCFLQTGAQLPDPDGLLHGSGTRVRHIPLETPDVLDTPAVRALMHEALARADVPFDRRARRRIVIKSISAKQRPRRPRPVAAKARR